MMVNWRFEDLIDKKATITIHHETEMRTFFIFWLFVHDFYIILKAFAFEAKSNSSALSSSSNVRWDHGLLSLLERIIESRSDSLKDHLADTWMRMKVEDTAWFLLSTTASDEWKSHSEPKCHNRLTDKRNREQKHTICNGKMEINDVWRFVDLRWNNSRLSQTDHTLILSLSMLFYGILSWLFISLNEFYKKNIGRNQIQIPRGLSSCLI